jgi:NADP-dependent 3-hydroxy acid dehydrogenase YdfG
MPSAPTWPRLTHTVSSCTRVAARNRSVDILINNAGFTIPDHFAKAEWQRESDMIMTLVYAVCSLTRAALPHMLAQGWGRIINVASVSGLDYTWRNAAPLSYAGGSLGVLIGANLLNRMRRQAQILTTPIRRRLNRGLPSRRWRLSANQR